MDGVINSTNFEDKHYHKPELHSKYLIGVLNQLKDIKGLGIVLSSTWRLYYYNTVEKVQNLFDSLNIELEPVGVTSQCCSGIRGVEIHEWMKAFVGYDYKKGGFKKKYVILDDDSDFLIWQHNNYLHIDRSVGITEEDVQSIKDFFEFDKTLPSYLEKKRKQKEDNNE